MHPDREWGTELLLKVHEVKSFHFANVVLPHIPTFPSQSLSIYELHNFWEIYSCLCPNRVTAHFVLFGHQSAVQEEIGRTTLQRQSKIACCGISVFPLMLCACVCFTQSPLRATFDMHSAWSPLGYYSFISGDLNVSIYSAFSLW